MSLVLNSTGGGSVTIQEPSTASNLTATLPAATGTVMVSGNMPAFRAVLSGNQTIPFNSFTKLTLNTEIFDTNNCYDPTTNYRFTPTVAGYYQVSLQLMLEGTPTRNYVAYGVVYKNGSANPNSYSGFSVAVGSGGDNSANSSMLISMNGTTDYLEAYTYQYDYTASSTMVAKASGTNFNACLVRAV